MTTDVLIIGGGIFGLCSAYAIAKRGMSVVVMDAGKIGGGASGGVVGALAPYVPDEWNQKRQFQLEALLTADDFWAEIDALSGLQSGYGRIGRVLPILDERSHALAVHRETTSAKLWPSGFDWTVLSEHAALSPALAPYGVIHETMSARLFPAMACQSLAAACVAKGVHMIENQRVTSIESGYAAGPWGELKANKIILAAGTDGFPLLDHHLGLETGTGVKGQAALLEADLRDLPQIYAEGVYIVPHANGTTAVGSTSEDSWDDPYVIDEKLDAVIANARAVCPRLASADIIQTWAGLRPKARRREPMLGPVPKLGGVFSAMGGFKIGFGLAHKIGDVMADFVEDKPVELPRNFQIGWHLS